MKIVNIEGVNLIVSDYNYEYYWKQRSIGLESDAFKTACRRLLGLGPNDHHLDTAYVEDIVWGDKKGSIDKIINSGLVEYIEKWSIEPIDQNKKGAEYTLYKENQLRAGLDPEFEDDFHI